MSDLHPGESLLFVWTHLCDGKLVVECGVVQAELQVSVLQVLTAGDERGVSGYCSCAAPADPAAASTKHSARGFCGWWSSRPAHWLFTGSQTRVKVKQE